MVEKSITIRIEHDKVAKLFNSNSELLDAIYRLEEVIELSINNNTILTGENVDGHELDKYGATIFIEQVTNTEEVINVLKIIVKTNEMLNQSDVYLNIFDDDKDERLTVEVILQ